MVIDIIVVTFILIIALKIIFDLRYIFITQKFIKERKEIFITKKINVLLIIPVLREQNIIEATLDYFTNFKLNNINLHVFLELVENGMERLRGIYQQEQL